MNEQFGYEYDAAANLKRRTNNALVQTFNVDDLNQLTNATRSGTLTVSGTTSAAATNVTVIKAYSQTNSVAPYGDNSFAAAGFSPNDGISVFIATAQDTYGRKDTNSVIAYLPVTPAFTHDANGNLISDGRRGFEYDDENQLIRVTVTNTWKSEFTYDGKMRRRVRKEFFWIGSWALTNEVRYVYDGNVVIQERDGSNLPLVTYTRGTDLSGTRQGAGGIGGLLAQTDQTQLPSGGGQPHAYYHADGNGNVTALLSANGVILARYVYDPFGNTLSKSGPLAEANLHRFSSKEVHANSGLIYYGRRFYEPSLQRWITKDPLGEIGGLNLYGFVHSNPVNRIDPFGLLTPEEIAALQAEANGTSQLITQQKQYIDSLNREIQAWRNAANAATTAEMKGRCSAMYNQMRAELANASAELRQLQAQLRRISNLLAGAGGAAAAAAGGLYATATGVFTAPTVGASFTGFGVTGDAAQLN